MSQHVHKHSLPIILIAFALLLISVLDFGHYDELANPSAFKAGLVGDITRLHPTTKGLAAITPPSPPSQPKPVTNDPQSSSMQEVVNTAGAQTQLDINLQNTQ